MKDSKLTIHQTWKNRNLIGSLKRCQDQWLEFCHKYGYNYKFHTDEDINQLIEKKFPQYWEKYKNFNYNIERVDFWRYAVLYSEGGVYADLDAFPLKDFTELKSNTKNLNNKSIILGLEPVEHARAYNGTEFLICNAFMIAWQKHNPFWLQLMYFICETYKNNQDAVYNTGPGALTRFYNSCLQNNSVQILDANYFNPITKRHTSKTQIYNNVKYQRVSAYCDMNKAYVVHMWDGSWSSSMPVWGYFLIGCGIIILLIFFSYI